MSQKHRIVFVCEHGAAKSVIAAAYFNQFARENNLSFHAIARGTNPDREISIQALEGLRRDGLTPPETVPQKLTLAEVKSAERIISFSELSKEHVDQAVYEDWSEIPPVSEDYEKVRDMILLKIKGMLK